MVDRVNLLVPAEVVPRLSMPDLALSTGEPDPVWVDVPVGRFADAWPYARRTVRLPYDRATATALRRRRRFAPLLLACTLAGVVVVLLSRTQPGAHLVWSSGLVGFSFAQAFWHTPTVPSLVPGGDLFLRGVPGAVADRWLAGNPGVRTVERRPVVRRYRSQVYRIAAVLTLIAAVQAIILPAAAAGSPPRWLWLIGPALLAGGITLAGKSIPFPHVRFAGR